MAPMEATMSDWRPGRFRPAVRLPGPGLYVFGRGFLVPGNRGSGVGLRVGQQVGFLGHQSVVLAVTGRVGLSIAGTVPGVLAREREFAL